ncbi:MAG: TRAP transporter substrate-binding protein [Planctomycetota bacterium]|jgi:tripartite ATP-independent transporter DctP family solute receptor|nr:TRAP transporter substrate-binding protein [Planctomycetota bacterium]
MKVQRIALFAALFLATFATAARAGQAKIIKVGHTGTAEHHYQMYLEKWAETISTRTAGRYKFEIYPSDLYGKPNQLIEGAQLGTVDMVLATGSLLTSYSPKYGVLNLPFLFENSMQACEILNGPIGKEIEESLAGRNLIVLGWWENGMRHLFPGNPVERITDLRGRKLRTINSAEMIDTINAFGASAVPMGFNEVYSAWQLKTIDGCEGTITHMLTQKYYELTKSAVLLWYMHVPNPLVSSKRLWTSIPKEDREIFIEESEKMSWFSFKYQNEMDEKEIRQCEELGVVFTKPDRAPFVEAVQPVWNKYRPKYGEMLDKILAATGKN